MEDSEFEQVLNDKFEEQYAQWKDTCKVETTETWEQLVIGAVGQALSGQTMAVGAF